MKVEFAAAAAFALLLSTGARADYCPPLTIEATAPMSDAHNGLVVVQATLGTIQRAMLIDTSTAVSEITSETVSTLQLPTFGNQFGMYNPSGNPTEKAAAVSPFVLGNVSTKSYTFRVSNSTALSVRDQVGGSIGTDVLRAYDVDFDFGGGKINLVSPDHCDGKVVYWHAAAVAVVPANILPDGRIMLSVTVDGHPLNALLDTGSAASTMNSAAARSLSVNSVGTDLTHTFQSLALEGISVSNPNVRIVPQLADSSGKPVDSATGADMTLGLDVLRHLHVYIAYKEQKLYVTPR